MIAVYLHIPFCETICTYCDFCKQYYNQKLVMPYLKALAKEIKATYKGEPVRTLYLGGGTPTALSIDELKHLFKIIDNFDLSQLEEFTIECNVENLTFEKIDLFKQHKVNRLSIGIQTFNHNFLSFLGRQHNKEDIIRLIDYAKKQGLNNINVDLMYGFPHQTMEELKEDLKNFFELKVSHISTYSLIIEEHTKLFIAKTKPLDDDINYDMYCYINDFLKEHNYHHYEISNYAYLGSESKHNLTYWDNEHYYGFGLGAASYIDNVRYENTRSMSHYIDGKYIVTKHILTKKEIMENEMILGLRKLAGVNKSKFTHKFGLTINEAFDITLMLKKQYLKENETYLFIPEDKMFISNEILINFID